MCGDTCRKGQNEGIWANGQRKHALIRITIHHSVYLWLNRRVFPVCCKVMAAVKAPPCKKVPLLVKGTDDVVIAHDLTQKYGTGPACNPLALGCPRRRSRDRKSQEKGCPARGVSDGGLVVVFIAAVCSWDPFVSALIHYPGQPLVGNHASRGCIKYRCACSCHFSSLLSSVLLLLLYYSETIPIFIVSSVTGHKLDLLKTFLNLLPADRQSRSEALSHKPTKCRIQETFNIAGVGPVVAAHVDKVRARYD